MEDEWICEESDGVDKINHHPLKYFALYTVQWFSLC